MTSKTHTLHIARLNNNCPTCFGMEGLEFTFSQTEKETPFFRKPSTQIEESLYCHSCKTKIHPVNWTEDIERVYDYNKKIAETNKYILKVKPLFYILIVVAIVLVTTAIYFLIPF
jgi:C4-type Zn-finger protein